MSDTVQQIKDRLNIVDVVAAYVELHKAGRHFKGKSPFSNERTPSFYVSPERGMYYCFSTNQGGDIFTFVQTMEGVEFKDALKILAEKANVEITKQAPEQRTKRDRYYAALEAATQFFEEKWETAKEAKVYLDQRGVHDDTRKTWRIGYAPGPPTGGWRELRTALNEQGFTDEELLAVGLIKKPEQGKDPFDVFRDRIVFPMCDTQGRVVAFSGRILHPNDKAPKYVNSPETQLYKKSELLFGYDKAKHGIRKLPFWLIAEGQFDVVMAHQAGYSNTVAVSGTALTGQHVQQLIRLCERAVLALDADKAGISAMQKAATAMLRRGMDVKVAKLPDGSDPADMVVENVEAFRKCIGSSCHVIQFLLDYLYTESRDERTYKLRVREELLPFVALIPNEIDREHFVNLVADRTNTTKEAILHEVQRLLARNEETSNTETIVDNETVVSEKKLNTSRKQDLLTYLVAAIEVVPTSWKKILQEKLEFVTEQQYDQLMKNIDTEKKQRYSFVIEKDFLNYNEQMQAEEITDRLNQLGRYVADEVIQACRKTLQEAEKVQDEKTVETELVKLKSIQEQRSQPLLESKDFINLSSMD